MKKKFPKTIEECDKQDCMTCGFLKKDREGFACTETKMDLLDKHSVSNPKRKDLDFFSAIK